MSDRVHYVLTGIELARRVVAHSKRRAQAAGTYDAATGADTADSPDVSDVGRRHITYGGMDTGSLIDNFPVNKATDGSGSSPWIKAAYDSTRSATAANTPLPSNTHVDATDVITNQPHTAAVTTTATPEESFCDIVNAPYTHDPTKTNNMGTDSAPTLVLKSLAGTASAVALTSANATTHPVVASALFTLPTGAEYPVYKPNEQRYRAALQEDDQLCLSMVIKVRNSQGNNGANVAERSAKVGFLFRQQEDGSLKPQANMTASAASLLSGVNNKNYQSGCPNPNTGGPAPKDVAAFDDTDAYIVNANNDQYPLENVTPAAASTP